MIDSREHFQIIYYRVSRQARITTDFLTSSCDATIGIIINGEELIEAAEGENQLVALYNVLCKVLSPRFIFLQGVALDDYAIQTLSSVPGMRFKVTVTLSALGDFWPEEAVQSDFIDAGFDALIGAFHQIISHQLAPSGAQL